MRPHLQQLLEGAYRLLAITGFATGALALSYGWDLDQLVVEIGNSMQLCFLGSIHGRTTLRKILRWRTSQSLLEHRYECVDRLVSKFGGNILHRLAAG